MEADNSSPISSARRMEIYELERAQRAREAAEQKLGSMTTADKDYALVEAKLKRALARIRTKS